MLLARSPASACPVHRRLGASLPRAFPSGAWERGKVRLAPIGNELPAGRRKRRARRPPYPRGGGARFQEADASCPTYNPAQRLGGLRMTTFSRRVRGDILRGREATGGLFLPIASRLPISLLVGGLEYSKRR